MIASTSRRWAALGALALGILVIGLDSTVLNVALPTLAGQLGASTGDQQWIIDSYSLVLAALLLPAGLLGDRCGRKRLLLTGLALFGAASAGCAWAGSPTGLIAARAILGIGGALIIPLSVAVLPTVFPPEQRARALAGWAAAMALGIPLGPVVGGLLLDHFWWGAVFLLNVPVVAAALVACAALLPESRDPAARRPDLLGVLTSTAGTAGVVYGTIQAPVDGWASAAALGPIGGGVVLLTGFLAWERRTPLPLLDPRWLADRRFSVGTAVASLVSFALFGVLFVVPQYLAAVAGHDALGTGLRLLPLIGGLVVGAKAGESVAARAGARTVVAAALVLLAGGLALGATTTVATGYGTVATWLVVAGLGIGLGLPTAMDVALSALPEDRVGIGSAAVMAFRQLAGALGVAVLGSVLAGGYRGGLPDSVPAAARQNVAIAVRLGVDSARGAFVNGMSALLVVCAAIVAGGLALVPLLPGRPPAPARDPAGSDCELVAT